ncbi:hypothetical protein [Cellulomonas sp. KRMCY2]|uniref:hypothetical protein n=1 Tax=Cellulomonas sp. KRMCY2 TaxID=1304865 RepID=UPI00045E9B2A|nr:hypothetical protein [Cellulomonas sp. KRMCY2]
MHPLTVYEIAVREHDDVIAQRTREQTLARRTAGRRDTRPANRSFDRSARPAVSTSSSTSTSDGRPAVA